RPELAAEVTAALEAAAFPASALTVEVTEDTLLRDASAVAAAFGAINALGVGIVLDRFGSGQASIAALRRFRLRGVKLDPALVTAGDRETSALLPALMGIASALSLPLAAAGVETEVQRARVQAMGCTEAQGPHFAQPLDAAAAAELLAQGAGALPRLQPALARVPSTPTSP
ncbi:MAG TPA: EAL domain-containing protein, partial [Vicinamibacteria bacterium]|nr:EAL domain-containing protein [Vicinamibacteria bacterium]